MRTGTILHYTLPTGNSMGVVNELVDVDHVNVIDVSGQSYQITRGQGHKDPDQKGGLASAIRHHFGITVSDCQKTTFGADAVHEAEGRYKLNQTLAPGFPTPLAGEYQPFPMLAQATERVQFVNARAIPAKAYAFDNGDDE